jgi:hypothetical protein
VRRPQPRPLDPALLHHAEELLHISNQTLDLTKAIHAMNIARSADGTNRT